MSQFDYRIPNNRVVGIIGRKIYLEDMSSQMIDIVKRLGAFQRPIGTDLVWMIKCSDDDELMKTLQELNRLGFFFDGANTGWSPADVFADFIERKKLSVKFKEIRSRGPGDWFIVER